MNDRSKQVGVLLAAVLIPVALIAFWGMRASRRLEQGSGSAAQNVAVAAIADDPYCTPQLKSVVRRVASACGLIDASGGRGCQPMQAKKVASLAGADFNALFKPLSNRAHIIQFDSEGTQLDEGAKKMIEEAWADQRGASFFFVVSRASTDGDLTYNEALSRDRAKTVLTHLQEKFHDPELEKQVGLLWLGEEFAQLDQQFCEWSRSRDGSCSRNEINRSAFVAWIDCAI